jgi:hypothetical protein
MHLKVFLKLKNPKNSLSSRQINKKKPKKTQTPKKPPGLGFLYKKNPTLPEPRFKFLLSQRHFDHQ